MAIMRPPIKMSGAMPSASFFMGPSSTVEITQEINASVGSTFIGNHHDEWDNAFFRHVVAPARQAMEQARYASASLGITDEWVPIETFDQLRALPPSMQLPVVMYGPVRKLLMDGRISGFGYIPESIPEENPYERLFNNGTIDNLGALPRDDQGNIPLEFNYEWHCTDPDLSIDQLFSGEALYATLKEWLAETDEDPTSPPNLIA